MAMNDKTKTGLEILQAALLLGILGDVLLRADAIGLNLALMVGATAAAMAMLFVRRQKAAVGANTWALLGAMAFFGAMFAFRAADQLVMFNILAIVAIFAILMLPSRRIKLGLTGVSHYIGGFIVSTFSSFFGPLLLVFNDIKWPEVPQKGFSKYAFSTLRGLLIATPLLLIFGALFMAADAAFEGLINRVFNFEIDNIISHVMLTCFLAWLAAGYLRGVMIPEFISLDAAGVATVAAPKVVPDIEPGVTTSVTDLPSEEPNAEAKPAPEPKKQRDWQNFDNSFLPKFMTFDSIEIGIVLGLVNILFFTFVVLQLPYLFGGMEFVQNTPDFKLADFARRGFGELVAVAALVLPILLVSHWLIKKDSPLALKLFRIFAGIQIVLLFVIMASAAQRILLLTGPLGYGMTTTRFYPIVFMIWLTVVFLWFCVTVMRGARNNFAWGALWSALVLLGALNVFNPEAYIASRNIELMKQGRDFDAHYNSNLGPDATPVLIEALPQMSEGNQCAIKTGLEYNHVRAGIDGTDLRNWNWSRKKANELVKDVVACGY